LKAKPVKQNLMSSKTYLAKPDGKQNLLSKSCWEAKPVEQNLMSIKTYLAKPVGKQNL